MYGPDGGKDTILYFVVQLSEQLKQETVWKSVASRQPGGTQ